MRQGNRGGYPTRVTYQQTSGFKGGRTRNVNGGGCSAAPPITMSLLVWNSRRLGNLHTCKELEVLIRAKDPFVVFLAETWADESNTTWILKICFL